VKNPLFIRFWWLFLKTIPEENQSNDVSNEQADRKIKKDKHSFILMMGAFLFVVFN